MAGTMFLDNRAYIALKTISHVMLPMIGVLYFLLWAFFYLPAVEPVLGTLMMLILFLNLFIRDSSRRYHKYSKIGGGEIVILTNNEGKRVYSLDLDDDPDNLINLDEVRFKVRKPRN